MMDFFPGEKVFYTDIEYREFYLFWTMYFDGAFNSKGEWHWDRVDVTRRGGYPEGISAGLSYDQEHH
jgi:hypothetical protein